ncbi:MAG TPA: VTT domain-containing protein [Rhizomicrobium sp.]|nr:VTT domain-containing protein [Rhizomicrobium sp.]
MSLSIALAKAGSLFFMTFVSEDAAMVGGAALTAAGLLATPLVFMACFLGIWLGDMGLYVLARYFGRPLLARPWVKRRLNEDQLAKSEAWLKKRGPLVLFVVRFVPGLRLPTYLLSGMLGMPFLYFAAATGAIALIWVGLFIVLAKGLSAAASGGWMGLAWSPLLAMAKLLAGDAWDIELYERAAFVVAALIAVLLLVFKRESVRKFFTSPTMQRWLKWEFWPARLFYFPIGLNYVRLGLKYGGFNLPTIANPGMYTGGLVGESKIFTLQQLSQTSAEFTARSGLIKASIPDRMDRLKEICTEERLELPLVLKPDVAQRGSGFKLARTWDDARDYLAQVTEDVVAQEYAPGPCEAGIFYYRFPDEKRGRIFAITEKIFPTITGDGVRTIEELVRADARAVIMAKTYLERHHAIRGTVLASGRILKLVEAGNHCQGCIFRDGMHLWSEALDGRIDEISSKVPGFFIGRYDVRYPAVADIRNGENFKIVELNGASSEATSIYDARNSIFRAYAILFKQWDLVFAIGAANRALGHRPATIALLREEWRKYQARSACYPLAD